jgi:hypothetical protein
MRLAVARVSGGGTTGTPNTDIEVSYGYDSTTGRLYGVTGPGLSSNGVTYTWHDDSDLVEEILFKDNTGTTGETNANQ